MDEQEFLLGRAALEAKVHLLEDSLSTARGCGLSIRKLREETAFLPYLRMLKGFAQRYCVMVVVCDTPVGPATTPQETYALKNIGLNVDLLGKYRCPYVVLVDAGMLIFEGIDGPSKYITQKFDLDDDEIELVSVGYGAQMLRSDTSIRINGKDCFRTDRGINIVVYDKVAKAVLDMACFDTYTAASPRTYPNMDFQALKKFAGAHPDVSIVCWRGFGFPTDCLNASEKFLKENNIDHGAILSHLDQPISPLHSYFDPAGIAEVLIPPKSYHDVNGVRRFENVEGKHVNTVGGHRVTAYQPDHFRHTIFMVGGCSVFGIGADDRRTIASFLQQLLNKNLPDHEIIVQNYGFFLMELDRQSDDVAEILNDLPVKPGDIIFYLYALEQKNELLRYYIDLSKIDKRPHSCEMFFDTGHYTPDGYRLVAEGLFQGLLNTGLLNIPVQPEAQAQKTDYGFDEDETNELKEYKSILRNWYQEMFGMTMGAVVMNCNPFTLGHRYLIEKALEQCDFLAVFAVQEDQSIFPFEDRLRLIDEGVADLKNVVVIPSGRFVLSSLTFSEYFNKSEMQDRIVDTSLDVTVFAKEIAPCLDIKKRFAGEEPFDKVTRQYNDNMRKILPEYGIEFVEIPRLETAEGPISASRVRTLLEERNFAAIRPLVPESTFQYLSTMFSQPSYENRPSST